MKHHRQRTDQVNYLLLAWRVVEEAMMEMMDQLDRMPDDSFLSSEEKQHRLQCIADYNCWIDQHCCADEVLCSVMDEFEKEDENENTVFMLKNGHPVEGVDAALLFEFVNGKLVVHHS